MNQEARPADLPDFESPPLKEVGIGIQFNPIPGYSHIMAGDVWAIFKEEFPKVAEQLPIEPTFEVFGNIWAPQPVFNFQNVPPQVRYWFVSQDDEYILQFQKDRLVFNWRCANSGDYPRFESLISTFEKHANSLRDFFSGIPGGQNFSINQCELNYVNVIQSDEESGNSLWNYVNFLAPNGVEYENFNVNLREIILNDAGTPQGRLYIDAALGLNPANNKKGISLNLTIRGAPIGGSIGDALDFFKKGRRVIVKRFAELTTDKAHKIWERKQ